MTKRSMEDDEPREYSSPACYLHEFESQPRVDSASLIVHAPAEKIYHAQLDPQPLAACLAPQGTGCRIKIVELIPDRRIAQVICFDSDEAARAGEMKITWTFMPIAEGTRVDVRCEDAPSGIRAEQHGAGLAAALANLAKSSE